jgi:hypothetical protein
LDAAQNPLTGSKGPTLEALRDYLSRTLPAGLDLKEVKNADDWTTCVRTALSGGGRPADGRSALPAHRRRAAPVLRFGAVAALDRPIALRRALKADLELGTRDAANESLLSRSLRLWIKAAWREAAVDAVRVEFVPLRAGPHPRPPKTAPTPPASCNAWTDTLALSRWLVTHPAQLNRCLADTDRTIRQQALALVLRNQPVSSIPMSSTAAQTAMIEALQADDIAANEKLARPTLALAGPNCKRRCTTPSRQPRLAAKKPTWPAC